MATLRSSATAHPPYCYNQGEVIAALPLWLSVERRLLALAQRVFENAAVQTRYGCRPLLHSSQPLSVTETSRLYRQYACQLGEEVVRESLARVNVAPGEVDLVITTSCTGL